MPYIYPTGGGSGGGGSGEGYSEIEIRRFADQEIQNTEFTVDMDDGHMYVDTPSS